MPRTICDKPTRALLKDMLTDLGLKPGQVFTSGRAVQWFAEHYPKLKPLTSRAHLVQASTNDAGRLHHTATSETDDLLFKVAPGQYRLYEVGGHRTGADPRVGPGRHGVPRGTVSERR